MNRVRTVWICFAIGGMVAVGVSLALARVHPFGDAGLYAASGAQEPIMNDAQVPSQVRAILVEKCADCHSTQTRAPMYGRFAPVSWLMERDINQGRKEMNLSYWDRYSGDQQQTFAAKIAHETRAHAMPLPQYRLIHWNARVNDAEIRTLANWAHGTSASEMDQSMDRPGNRPARATLSGARNCLRNVVLDAIP